MRFGVSNSLSSLYEPLMRQLGQKLDRFAPDRPKTLDEKYCGKFAPSDFVSNVNRRVAYADLREFFGKLLVSDAPASHFSAQQVLYVIRPVSFGFHRVTPHVPFAIINVTSAIDNDAVCHDISIISNANDGGATWLCTSFSPQKQGRSR